jgi:lipid II:glycine glycyltransferase (peptidoglycan interpeptide bridge formation enzyme)
LFSVDQFFTIMTNAFIRRGLKPRHPKNFFHGLIAINKVSPVLFYAKLNSIVISTALTVIDGGRRIYLSGGSTTDGLKYCASSAIQDAIIKDSISFGCERYDIGGYGNEGIDKFKKGFSGKKYEKARYVYESIIIKHLKNIYLKLKGVN